MNNSYVQTAGSSLDSLDRVLKRYKEIGPTATYFGGENIAGRTGLRKELFFHNMDFSIYEFVTSFNRFPPYIGVKRNDPCPCGSDLLYGDCCRYKVRALDKFMELVNAQGKHRDYAPYTIPGCAFRELNIFEHYAHQK